MEELINKMKGVLADTFAMYIKAHGYHWNVIGADFPQLHSFFEDVYGELWAAVDDIAEQIRQLDAFAQGTLSRMKELSSIEESDSIPTAPNMVTNLISSNEAILNNLKEAYKLAEENEIYGLSNFLQDRMMAHKKLGWKLKATAGRKQ